MKEIESPLVCFNNIISNLTSKIENIYFGSKQNNMEFIKSIIFQNTSIVIGNFVKLQQVPIDNSDFTRFEFSFLGKLTYEDTEMVTLTINKLNELESVLNYYCMVIKQLDNPDTSVSDQYLNQLRHQILCGNANDLPFLLPVANKLAANIGKKILSHHSFFVKFNKDKNKIRYSVIKTEALANPEITVDGKYMFNDIDVLVNGVMDSSELTNFLFQLFYYGRINGAVSTKLSA